jgi:hypothetical protein
VVVRAEARLRGGAVRVDRDHRARLLVGVAPRQDHSYFQTPDDVLEEEAEIAAGASFVGIGAAR